MIFEFTCYINPPTKNEKETAEVWSKKKNRKVRVIKKVYSNPWNEIENEMFKKRFGITKEHFDKLHESDKIKMQKTLTKEKVVVTLFNAFKRMDLLNFETELMDRLQGIAYCNDSQIKSFHADKLDDEEKEFFKVIVELL